jgi:hypothetical protein
MGRSAAPATTGPERLTSRARLAQARAEPVAVGTEIKTFSGQPRRVLLPGGSVLYVNRDTRIKVESARKVSLAQGEIYVEPEATKESGSFVVQTPRHPVTGQGAFTVRTGTSGTSVVVIRGQARIEGVKGTIKSGQRLTPANSEPVAAPRASHVLGWARDLMVAAEAPLVPGSRHAGGALIAVNPDGQEAKLSLRKYHVDVHIEDGFARTTIDQTYFNHEPTRLEGTFYFPLPADASLSRLAMYVDGNLMEDGMVERDYARQVYETILYQQRDPALLEWVDGTTFKMRVFPLEPRQEKRIILSYTQKLPGLYGQTQYRFPAGHSLQLVRDWSFHARIKNGADRTWNSPSHALNAVKEDGDLLLDAAAKDAKFDKDVQLTLTDPQPKQKDAVTFSATDHDGARYLMLRYRPQIENRKSKIKKTGSSCSNRPATAIRSWRECKSK